LFPRLLQLKFHGFIFILASVLFDNWVSEMNLLRLLCFTCWIFISWNESFTLNLLTGFLDLFSHWHYALQHSSCAKFAEQKNGERSRFFISLHLKKGRRCCKAIYYARSLFRGPPWGSLIPYLDGVLIPKHPRLGCALKWKSDLIGFVSLYKKKVDDAVKQSTMRALCFEVHHELKGNICIAIYCQCLVLEWSPKTIFVFFRDSPNIV
jgi:hypothetical protein